MPSWTPDDRHSVTPRLVAEDPAALVRFLRDVFDAKGEFESGRPSEMRIGDSVVMVSGTDAREPTRSLLYVYVEDVDATYGRALHAGAVSLEEPQPTPWGDRRAIVKDAFGNNWQIATHDKGAR